MVKRSKKGNTTSGPSRVIYDHDDRQNPSVRGIIGRNGRLLNAKGPRPDRARQITAIGKFTALGESFDTLEEAEAYIKENAKET